jgi:hypothetical protein
MTSTPSFSTLARLAALALPLAGCLAAAPVDSTGSDATPPNWNPAGEGGGPMGSHAEPWRVLDVRYEAQQTGYWCGPTATDIVLSARIPPPGQASLANQLGTTVNGTDWIGQVTGVLNDDLHAPWYVTREMPNDPPTQAQRDLLWSDLTRAIDDGFPLVANIVAPPSNHPPGYPKRTIYHYFAVIGYYPDTRQAYIADPADFGGHEEYWLSFDQLATLIPPKGYTALASCTRGAVVGEIANKYDALGGCNSVLGPPITEERGTPDGVGRYSVFEEGSIYWTPQLGAHEVHGRIRDAWAAAGWEAGRLGYPISDEYADGDGRRRDFELGSIHWSAATDTTTISP